MKEYSQNLGHWIKRYSLLANQAMDDALKPYGIGRTQWYILYHINESTLLPQRKLQEYLHVESATLTTLVGSLVRKGLVSQEPDLKDKRGKNLALTAEGRALWEILPDPIDAVRSIALRNISSKDIEIARGVLEAAVHNLTKGE